MKSINVIYICIVAFAAISVGFAGSHALHKALFVVTAPILALGAFAAVLFNLWSRKRNSAK
jgi:hypothetical protein